MTDNNKVVIRKKSNLKGGDGYRTFSVRIKEDTVKQLDEMAEQTNRALTVVGAFFWLF